jgi:hypothetical protein
MVIIKHPSLRCCLFSGKSLIFIIFCSNVMYILCLYKKDVSRGDFGVSQSGPKGVISEIAFANWSICVYTVDGVEVFAC